jgi:predicted nucleic acid-binding Zn ribbon protein
MAKPKSLRSIVEETLKGLEIDGYVKTHSIFFKWNEIVGEAIAQQAQPRSIRNRILFLDVSHSTWMQQLQFFKSTLIEKINAFLGEPAIQDIRFRVGPISQARPPSEKAPSWENEPLDETTIKAIEGQLQKIDDAETRNVLRDIWIKGAKLERHRRKK